MSIACVVSPGDPACLRPVPPPFASHPVRVATEGIVTGTTAILRLYPRQSMHRIRIDKAARVLVAAVLVAAAAPVTPHTVQIILAPRSYQVKKRWYPVEVQATSHPLHTACSARAGGMTAPAAGAAVVSAAAVLAAATAVAATANIICAFR